MGCQVFMWVRTFVSADMAFVGGFVEKMHFENLKIVRAEKSPFPSSQTAEHPQRALNHMSERDYRRGVPPDAPDVQQYPLEGDQELLPEEPTPAERPRQPGSRAPSRELLAYYHQKLEEFDGEQERVLATIQQLKKACTNQVGGIMCE